MLEKGTVKKAFKWQIGNITLQAILQFAFIILSARLLEPEILGAYALINAFIFVLSITSEGGMSLAIIQSKEVNDKLVSISFYITMGLSLLMFLLVTLFAKNIAEFYDYKVTPMQLIVASSIFIFKAVGSVSRSFLIREFRFKEIFIATNLSFFVGNILVLILLVNLDMGVYALIGAASTMVFFFSMINYYYARHSLKFKWGREEFKFLYHFGAGSILLQTTNYLSSQMDKMLIGKYFAMAPLSMMERGQFIAKMPPKYIGNSIDSIMFSAFSKITKDEQKTSYYKLIMKVVMTFVYLFGVFFFFNAEVIVQGFLGPKWTEAVPFLQVFAFSMPPIILARLGDVIVRAENKMYNSFFIKIGFLLSLVAVILWLKSSTLLNVTIGIVITYWLHSIAMLILSARILKSSVLSYATSVLIPIGLAIIFAIKYYIIELLPVSAIWHLVINLLIDIALLGAVLYRFRENDMIASSLEFIKNKIKPKG